MDENGTTSSTNPETPPANGGKEPAEADRRSITKAVEAFLCEVDALADALPLIMPLVTESRAKASKDFETFLQRRCKKIGEHQFEVPTDEYTEFQNLKRRLDRNRRASQIVPRSFFTSLVSHYDAFLGNLLRAVFYMRPEVLNDSEHRLTFKELTSFTSIDAARESVVEKEVESFLRESHAEQFKRMEAKFGIPLTKDLRSWPTFIEITERRNLFVHCNGVVSEQYLSVCKRHGVDCSKVKVGAELNVTPKYFGLAYSVLVEIGIKLAHVLWRRLKPDQIEQADASVNNCCLDLIRDEKYAAAQTILDFAVGFKNFSSETGRRILVLNRAQTYKWMGQHKKAMEILEAEDWDAANEKFQLGAAVLRDDFTTAAKLMRHIGADASPSKGDYRDWPMFRVFRETPEFAQAYEDIFGEPFGSIAADIAEAPKNAPEGDRIQ